MKKKTLGWSGDRGHLHDHLLHELADGDTVSSRIQKTAEAAVKDQGYLEHYSHVRERLSTSLFMNAVREQMFVNIVREQIFKRI